MKRHPLFLVLSLVLGCATLLAPAFALPALQADTPANHVALLRATVYPLQWFGPADSTGKMERGTNCTVFSVSASQRRWMTCAHCVMDLMTHVWHTDAFFIDGHPARVVAVDVEKDLATMETTDWGVTESLRLATHAPEQGDTVENMGYPWGLEFPFYFRGVVASVEYPTFVFVVMPAIGGQSGSPLIDTDGRVVGVAHIHLGLETVLGFTTYRVLQAFDGGMVFAQD